MRHCVIIKQTTEPREGKFYFKRDAVPGPVYNEATWLAFEVLNDDTVLHFWDWRTYEHSLMILQKNMVVVDHHARPFALGKGSCVSVTIEAERPKELVLTGATPPFAMTKPVLKVTRRKKKKKDCCLIL